MLVVTLRSLAEVLRKYRSKVRLSRLHFLLFLPTKPISLDPCGMATHSGVIRTKPKEITDLLKEIRGKWKYSTFGWNEEKYYHTTWYDQAREEVRNCLGYLANGDNQGLRRSDEKLDFPKFEYDKIKTELKSLLREAGTGKNEAGTDKIYDRPYKLVSLHFRPLKISNFRGTLAQLYIAQSS